MKAPALLPLLIAALILTASAGLAQSGRGRGDDDGNDRREDRSGEGRLGLGRGFQAQSHGSALTGDYVSFSYSPGGLENYTVDGARYFDAAVTGEAALEDETEARAAGAEIRLKTDAYKLKAHDNRRGTLRLETDGVLALTFTDGATLTPMGKGVLATLATGERSYVFGHSGNALTVAGATLTTEGDVHFHVLLGEGQFTREREALSQAAAEKKVGAEVRLARAGTDVLQDVVAYGNVTVETLVQPGNVTLLVEGHGSEGRILVLDVSPGLVGAAKADELNVLFDNVTIRPADGLVDVLDPDDDGLHPEYHLVEDEDGFHFIVSIPHYSVHTLSIVGLVQEVPPSVVAGVLIGIAVVASGGFVLFRRPKRG